MAPAAVLFDLDDTLCDRAAGLRRYAERLAGDFADRLGPAGVGRCHAALVACDDYGSIRQADALNRTPIWRVAPSSSTLKAHWDQWFGRSAVAFGGVEELLALLCDLGVKSCIVTNGSAAMQRSKVDALGVGRWLDEVIVSGEVGVAKPDPAVFRLALTRLGVSADDAWFVGDHPDNDVRAAARVGLRAFWVRTGAFRDAPEVPGTPLAQVADLRHHLS